MKLFKSAPVWVLCLLLSAQAVAGLFDKDPPPAIRLDANTDRSEAFKQLIDDGAALRHISKPYSGSAKSVVIGQVKLTFITDSSSTAATKEFMGNRMVSASTSMKLLGVSQEDMRAVTDNFYSSLKTALLARGYEVIDQEKLLENADFKRAAADTKMLDTSFSGAATTLYATGTAAIDGFGMRNFSYNLKLPVLKAHIVLHFASFEKDTQRFGLGADLAATASVKSAVKSAVSGSVSVMTEDGGGQIFEFVRPLDLPSNIAGSVADKGATTGQMAANVFGALLGGNSSSDNNVEVTAVKNYREVVSGDLNMLAEVLANSFAKK